MADKPLKVYAIEESTSSKKYWREVGCAWKNRDGSYNIKLYMMPLLKLQLRDDDQPKDVGPEKN